MHNFSSVVSLRNDTFYGKKLVTYLLLKVLAIVGYNFLLHFELVSLNINQDHGPVNSLAVNVESLPGYPDDFVHLGLW